MKKRYSEEQIIKAIKQHEAGAKVDDICRELGISNGTFYNWRSKYAGLEVNEAELEELGLVVESESQGSSGVGRPSLMVAPNENVVAFSVNPEIDATTVSVVTLSGQVIDRRRKLMGSHPSPEDAIRVSAEVISEMRKAFRPGTQIAGVGVSVPGQVRTSDGVIRYAPQLGWVESAFATALSQETGLNVFLGNDASLGCLAEARFGTAKNVNDLVFLFAGSGGIGGGVVSNGMTVGGAAGYAGELGHMKVSSSGRLDYSGLPGTLESLVRREDLLDFFKLYVATDEELAAEIRSSESSRAEDSNRSGHCLDRRMA